MMPEHSQISLFFIPPFFCRIFISPFVIPVFLRCTLAIHVLQASLDSESVRKPD